MPHSLRLYKREKLCSRTDVNNLFAVGRSAIAYPLRVVYAVKTVAEGDDTCPQFLITIPKKKIRKAVGRVLLRRRVREAYRLSRHLLPPEATPGKRLQMAFVWLSGEKADYALIESRMRELLVKVATATAREKTDAR